MKRELSDGNSSNRSAVGRGSRCRVRARLGAAAFGIAVMSPGAAMWLQPAAGCKVRRLRRYGATGNACSSRGEDVERPLAQAKPEPAAAAALRLHHVPGGRVGAGGETQRWRYRHRRRGRRRGGWRGPGNQIGKGNGRKAMTVLGAVGGGFAGHEIKKRARAETVYSVRVRMNDGTWGTVTRQQPVAVGARAAMLNGQTLRARSRAARPPAAERRGRRGARRHATLSTRQFGIASATCATWMASALARSAYGGARCASRGESGAPTSRGARGPLAETATPPSLARNARRPPHRPKAALVQP